MLSTLRNAWKVPELRKRMLFTLAMILVYRLGNYIPVSGVDTSKLLNLTNQSGSLLGLYNMMTGGAFSQFSIFAMGIIPYINSSIIMQLLTVAIPSLEQLSKEGEEGRKKIQKITRYLAVPLAALQTLTIYAAIRAAGALKGNSAFSVFLMVFTLTTASTFLMWLGDQITDKGIGNGASLIIFVNIISRFPSTMYSIIKLKTSDTINVVEIVVVGAIAVALFVAVVIETLSERRIPIQYAGKAVAGKVSRKQSSHIPINMNASIIIAIIFAISVMLFPTTIAQFWPKAKVTQFLIGSQYSPFKEKTIPYMLMYFILIVFFTWFYTQITFKPEEMSENIHKSSGFIPGIRPGEPTTRFIERVLDKMSILGGVFASVIAIAPMIIEANSSFQGIHFASTGLLIVVGVALENLRIMQSQLTMRHYHGFLSE